MAAHLVHTEPSHVLRLSSRAETETETLGTGTGDANRPPPVSTRPCSQDSLSCLAPYVILDFFKKNSLSRRTPHIHDMQFFVSESAGLGAGAGGAELKVRLVPLGLGGWLALRPLAPRS